MPRFRGVNQCVDLRRAKKDPLAGIPATRAHCAMTQPARHHHYDLLGTFASLTTVDQRLVDAAHSGNPSRGQIANCSVAQFFVVIR
jgi:hypothetical protein